MTNLIAFPSRRRALALEIELVRARLAQVRGEVRLTNTIWFWYCFSGDLGVGQRD